MTSLESARILDAIREGLRDWRYHHGSDNFIQKTPNSGNFEGRTRAQLIARIAEILTARGTPASDADLRKHILPRLQMRLIIWADDARFMAQHFWPGVEPGA